MLTKKIVSVMITAMFVLQFIPSNALATTGSGSNYVSISNFENNSSDGWVAGDHTDGSSISIVHTYSDPVSAAEGVYFLKAQKDLAFSSDTMSYITKTFSSPIDLSQCDLLNFNFFGWGIYGPSDLFKVELILSSNGTTQTYNFNYVNGWKDFTCNISEFSQRNAVTSISIGYGDIGSSPISSWNGHFFIDDVRAYTGVSLGNFEDATTNGWAAGTNGGTPVAVTSDIYGGGSSPNSAAQGSYFLQALRNGIAVTDTAYINKAFAEPMDLSVNSTLHLQFYGWGGAAESYLAVIKVNSQSGSQSYNFSIVPGIWTSINFSLSEFPYDLENITSVSIGYRGVNSTIGDNPWGGSFSIDNVRADSIPKDTAAQKKITIDNFDQSGNLNGWELGDYTSNVGVLTGGLDGGWPYNAYSGNFCLSARKQGVDATTVSYVQKTFVTPLNLSNCTQFGYALAGWGGVSSAYWTELVLTSTSGETRTYQTSIQSDAWRTVAVDISDIPWKNSIANIKISYSAVDNEVYRSNFPNGVNWGGCFSIDGIYALQNGGEPATNILQNKSTTMLGIGSTESLNVTIVPSDATNKTVIWTSSNEQIATVDGNGLVTGVAVGTASIKATTQDGGFTADCSVTVMQSDLSVSSISEVHTYVNSSPWPNVYHIQIAFNHPVNTGDSLLFIENSDVYFQNNIIINGKTIQQINNDSIIYKTDGTGVAGNAIQAHYQDGVINLFLFVTAADKFKLDGTDTILFKSGFYTPSGHLLGNNSSFTYNTNTSVWEPTKPINLDNYNVANTIITNVLPKTTIGDFRTSLQPLAEADITITNTYSDSGYVGTGTTVNASYYGNTFGYTVVIYGDVDGDGIIGLNDLTLIRDHLLEATQLEGVFKTAGNLYGENDITLNDLVGIMAKVSESGEISQSR